MEQTECHPALGDQMTASPVDGVRFQVFEIAVRERGLVRGGQIHPRGKAGVERLLPAWRTETPAVAFAEAGEAVLQNRRREIVPRRLGELQKSRSHLDANRVRADVFRRGIAAAVAKEAGHRRGAADFEFAAKHVFGLGKTNDVVSGSADHDAELAFRWFNAIV
jgi:hypothetical protein